MHCKKIIASGRVQGVYYRASLQRKARELGLRGYVQNLKDGKVEAMVLGTEEAIADLVNWCKEGPPMAVVKNVEVVAITTPEKFTDFEIRRTAH